MSIFINAVFFVLLYVKQAHCLAFLLVSVMKMCALNWCLQLQSVTLKKIIFVALWTAGTPMWTGLLVEETFAIPSPSFPKTTHLTVN